MRLTLSSRARSDYQKLSPLLRKLTDKQFDLLLGDLRYPSLHAKKYDESRGIWQGRISRDYRFYFQIEKDEYIILTIIKHPK